MIDVENSDAIIVFTTTRNLEEAESLANGMINQRLAACVQILPQVTSVYCWEGKIQKENEHLLLIKTLHTHYDHLETFIKANHSYETPEIVAVRAESVSAKYREWMSLVLQ